MAATKYSPTLRNAELQTIVTLADGQTNTATGSATAGVFALYSGAQPATGVTTPSGTLLTNQQALNVPFGTVSGQVLTVNTAGFAIVGSVAAGAGGTTAGYYWQTDNAGNFVQSGTVGLSGSGASLILSSTTISTGESVSITSWTITAGNS